jgi:hypothetical protein
VSGDSEIYKSGEFIGKEENRVEAENSEFVALL